MYRQPLFLLLLGLAAGSLAYPARATGAVLEVPIALDYRILEDALREQVFADPQDTAEVFADKHRCNALVLSEPRVSGTDLGRVRLLMSMNANTGTFFGGKCRFAKNWRALIETQQTAHTNAGTADAALATVSFKVVDSTILHADDQTEALPDLVRTWVNQFVHPRLDAVIVDLGPALAGIQEVFDSALQDPAWDDPALDELRPEAGQAHPLSSLRLQDVKPSAAALVAVLALDVPDAPDDWQPPVESVLTDEELAEWDAAWQAWDGFATWMIKTLALSAGPEVIEALAETLIEARYELRDALARDDRQRDQVRALFLSTWERLAPVAHQIQLGLPGAQAMRYAGFVSAGNALQAMDTLAPHLGIRIDSHSLRSLARVLVPGVSDYDLRYDTTVDPELRQLLGFPAEFDDDEETASILSWFIGDAHAVAVNPELTRRLKDWVPKRREIDDYLSAVEQLLASVAATEHDRDKVPAAHFALYDTLLRATAYQESCWRQYVQHEGAVETIRSPAGSVGLMQVNLHVWRGVYDVDALLGNVSYNTRAGNEILVHYLVDYAIRKEQAQASGEPENLARATYAVYNGGPRHLTRYRNPKTSASLKQIDDAFLEKYRGIQNEGQMAVKQCLVG